MSSEERLLETSAEPVPEAARLAALKRYNILDTAPEEAFERITALASKIFAVPIALITLVDSDRQWFKSCYGLDLRETDRKISFCTYAIESDEVMVVLNALEDPRFVDNPLVTGELHIRFYAGAPLRTPDGYNLGSLCLINTEPHESFGDVQQGMLADLAAVVVNEIEPRSAGDALQASEARYRIVAETASDAIITIDEASRIRYANGAASKIFGYARTELQGHDLTLLMPDYLRHLHEAALKRYVETGVRHMHWEAIEIPALHKSGAELPVEVSFGEHHENGKRLFTGIMRDITERKRAQEQLETLTRGLEQRVAARTAELADVNAQLLHDAFHDKLTGLANRALFLDRLGQASERQQRRNDGGFAVLYLDTDRFKVVNDSLGHTVGDQLLVALGERLRACVRPGDTVARFGGDEFVFLLDDTALVEEATRVAERIQREVRKPFMLGGRPVHISVSIGVVMSGTCREDAEGMLRDADIAMYHAKALGKARYQVFTEAMRDHAVSLLALENDLRGAVSRDELRVHYQPIRAIQGGRLSGFEALVRWRIHSWAWCPPQRSSRSLRRPGWSLSSTAGCCARHVGS